MQQNLTGKLEIHPASTYLKNIPNFIRPCPHFVFDIHNPYGIKLLTRSRLGLGSVTLINVSLGIVFKIEAVNCYYKELQTGCFSSPRPTSDW